MILQIIRIAIIFNHILHQTNVLALPALTSRSPSLSRSSSINSAGNLSPNTYLRSPSPPYSLHASPARGQQEDKNAQIKPIDYAKKASRLYAKASFNHAGLAIKTGIQHTCAGVYGAMKCIGKAGLTKAGIMHKDLSKSDRKIQAKQHIQSAKQIFHQSQKEAKQQFHDKAIETSFMIAESVSNRKIAKRPRMAKGVYGDKNLNSIKETKDKLHSFRNESKQKQRNSIRQNSRL